MNKDIEKALVDLRTASSRYAKPTRYYDGDHDLAFATEKFENAFGTLFREFALNLCPVVCDAVRDKLHVAGFSADSLGGHRVTELQSLRNGPDPENSVDSVNSATRRIWHANRMAVRAGEVHKEALKNGDAYAIVWPDASGRAAIVPAKSGEHLRRLRRRFARHGLIRRKVLARRRQVRAAQSFLSGQDRKVRFAGPERRPTAGGRRVCAGGARPDIPRRWSQIRTVSYRSFISRTMRASASWAGRSSTRRYRSRTA